ncbi:AI-2E family transporter [Kaistia dalseonensis]|uniref:PurR-regulated permease PerM n=1 Tax=Kaistia dalseonensis TaxID=410840 RepID=A0ABU0H736_9HYPH|nr:AI-2E family transporter [Kaistia dalseonensis]MCX5495514.1 AI-2E family transporter [Kaistia dalseonensis]MDQ0438106.1 putative PurR-regulated permease PerM [Kaistia dalseonensis]
MSDPLVKFEVPTTETQALEPPDLAGETGPITSDLKLLVLTCLLIIALLAVAYFAADIILPIVLAIVLKLLLQPGMRALEKLRLPRSLAALLLITAIFAFIVAIGAAMSGPAAAWAAKLPEGIAKMEERLRFLSRPIQTLQTFLHQFDAGASAGGTGPTMSEMLLKGTQHFASGFFETLLILFFLLISGDTFLRRMVEIVPSFRDKRRVVELSQQIEENVSAYLVTITLMNAAVGVATGIAMWACGLGDPILWGGVAFLLNYVPIMGPFVGVGLFLLAGQLSIDAFWQSLLPAGLYLVIHVIEGETVTPILLARRFTLNPVLVIISLIFWFWMWGVPGAILAVPMLAITKIVCDGIRPLNPLGHFLEG